MVFADFHDLGVEQGEIDRIHGGKLDELAVDLKETIVQILECQYFDVDQEVVQKLADDLMVVDHQSFFLSQLNQNGENLVQPDQMFVRFLIQLSMDSFHQKVEETHQQLRLVIQNDPGELESHFELLEDVELHLVVALNEACDHFMSEILVENLLVGLVFIQHKV